MLFAVCADTRVITLLTQSLWLQLNDLTQQFGNALVFSLACYLIVFFLYDLLAVHGLTSDMERGLDSVNSTFAASAVMLRHICHTRWPTIGD
jgi:hypothetical protein